MRTLLAPFSRPSADLADRRPPEGRGKDGKRCATAMLQDAEDARQDAHTLKLTGGFINVYR